MQSLMILGSRNVDGRTARCANAIGKGLAKHGVTSDLVFLPTLKLERCRQCDPDGWGVCRREGRCVVQDDFPSVVDRLKATDVAVFANPVYFRDLSESMKTFLERLRRISFRQQNPPMQGKPAIGVCLAGGGGGGAPSASFNLETILQMIGFDVVDMINVRRQNIDVKVPMLEMTGEWLATKPESGPMPVPPPR
jgi:multimeric flavodoxin WrbA